MSIRIGNRPPVNAPDKVRRDDPNGKKLVFDAKWDVRSAPPNTEVGLTAVSKVPIEGTTAQIKIFQLLNKQRTYLGSPIYAPYENGQVKAVWRTTPVKGGDFEAGEYHYEVSVGNYCGETIQALLLRGAAQTGVSSFESAKPKPKVVF